MSNTSFVQMFNTSYRFSLNSSRFSLPLFRFSTRRPNFQRFFRPDFQRFFGPDFHLIRPYFHFLRIFNTSSRFSTFLSSSFPTLLWSRFSTLRTDFHRFLCTDFHHLIRPDFHFFFGHIFNISSIFPTLLSYIFSNASSAPGTFNASYTG